MAGDRYGGTRERGLRQFVLERASAPWWRARGAVVVYAAVVALMVPGIVAAGGDGFEGELAAVVDAHRTTLLLLEDADRAPQKAAGAALGRAWSAHAQLDASIERLAVGLHEESAVLATGEPPPQESKLRVYLDYVAQKQGLHDGDRLAFIDITSDILVRLNEEKRRLHPDARPLHEGLQQVATRLESIRKRFGEEVQPEVSQAFDLETEPLRPRWRAYLQRVQGARETRAFKHMPMEYQIAPDTHLAVQRRADVLYGDDLGRKEVVLTFDDGPHARRTVRILDILAQHDAKACFFQVGQRLGVVRERQASLGAGAETSRRILAAGHQLANHSYSHPVLTKLSARARAWQITATNQLLADLPSPRPRYFRPPYGASGTGLLTDLASEGMTSVMWNVDSRDWADRIPESVVRRVVNGVVEHGRGIVLFHDIHEQTVLALPAVLRELARLGYSFRLLPEGA